MSVTFKSHVKDFYDEFDIKVKQCLETIGMRAEGHAKKIMAYTSPKPPIDTGYLRNSITWAIGGEKTNISRYEADRPDKKGEIKEGIYNGESEKRSEPCVYIGTNVKYGPSVELGTIRMKARPYLKPAIEDFKDEYKEICKDFLGDI